MLSCIVVPVINLPLPNMWGFLFGAFLVFTLKVFHANRPSGFLFAGLLIFLVHQYGNLSHVMDVHDPGVIFSWLISSSLGGALMFALMKDRS